MTIENEIGIALASGTVTAPRRAAAFIDSAANPRKVQIAILAHVCSTHRRATLAAIRNARLGINADRIALWGTLVRNVGNIED